MLFSENLALAVACVDISGRSGETKAPGESQSSSHKMRFDKCPSCFSTVDFVLASF